MSESDQEQSSPEPLSPRTAAVRAGLRRNYSSSSTESKSYESESSSKMAEIPNNNNNVGGGAALVVQPRKPLCEFSIPKVTDQPSCIVYPQLTVDRFELKSGMIHLLPTYYGNTTEDPYMHIKQFFEICATIKIQGLDDEQIKMRLFPFSLKDKAKSWLYSLPNASIHTWEELSNKFLQKFFPAQKTNKIRQEILRFTQKEGEAFHECWERYKEMISSCPHHNIETWMQMQSFYEGLLDSERMMVDATSGEGLMNKTADEAFTLFESLSANSQQWSHNKGRGAPMKAVVSEVSTNNEIAAKLDVMCSLLQQAVTGPLGSKVEVQDQSFAEHMLEQANALQARNPNNDPYSNTYNPGWRNHPNFKWSNNSNVQQSQGPPPGFQIQQRQFQQAPQQVQEQKGDQMGELQDMFDRKMMMKQMAINQSNFQQTTQAALSKLEVQIGQIAAEIAQREPREMAKPNRRLKKANQDKAFKEIYDILSKVNINLPLLDVVKQIPAYGKFIKHLITHKLNFAPSEEVKLNKNAGRAMLDLGASINVMPYSVYQELGLEGMKKTSIRLELADHSIKYPKGIVEDILVQVNTLILPADFVVMDMEDNPHEGRVDPILLGRPFMATANTIINVKDGTLSMTVLGETIAFKVFDALKPNVVQECFQIE
ncbi:unnamed protein product, partial [Prunus brigantina]